MFYTTGMEHPPTSATRHRVAVMGGLMSSRQVAGIVLIAACLMAGSADAQFGVAWQQSPKITVIGADNDPRQPLMDEAVAFWNRTLEELGSGFRLAFPRSYATSPGTSRSCSPIPISSRSRARFTLLGSAWSASRIPTGHR